MKIKRLVLKIITILFTLSTLLLVVSPTSCSKNEKSSKNELTRMDILLDWQAEPTYLGVYYAKQLGLFEKIGIDANIVQSWGANAAVAAVASGKYKIATASGGATVLGYNATTNVVSLGVLYPHISTIIYGLAKENLQSPESLKGKKIGLYPGSVTVSEFSAFVSINHLDTNSFSTVSISGADIPLLKSGQIDLVLHYREMSPAQVEASPEFPQINGHRISELALADYGVKGYGLNVIANKAEMAQNGNLIKQVAAAIFEGYRAACENPDAALLSYLKLFPEKDPAYAKESFNQVRQLVNGNYGKQTAEGWDETIQIYKDLELIARPIQGRELIP
jgi:NitT/TauT family transport system substrate-binding protein